MSNNRGKKNPTTAKNEEEDPVVQLLQSAQDELLLKLSVDSHMSRVSPDYLLPDLDRRFQALRSRPTSTTIQSSAQPPPAMISKSQASKSQEDDADPDDLFARFAALKASDNTNSSTVLGSSGFDQGDDEEEDEVEKIIKWAKDSARLDPSPPSDEEEDDHDDSDDEDDEDDGKVGNRK
ncbi:unnamed protein product [Dovyalis caffra]|uniref:Uncharacterized protein n=1 Tax=Dovyalis caffra TaxID=77055 RepID=A0AAV1RPK1_9ROSI|nr:unnamed protein product [Dovyalis caffra]